MLRILSFHESGNLLSMPWKKGCRVEFDELSKWPSWFHGADSSKSTGNGKRRENGIKFFPDLRIHLGDGKMARKDMKR